MTKTKKLDRVSVALLKGVIVISADTGNTIATRKMSK